MRTDLDVSPYGRSEEVASAILRRDGHDSRATQRDNPFDVALALDALSAAAQAYAAERGEPGSVEYRAAWLDFRQRVRTTEDLQEWQSQALGERREELRRARAARAGRANGGSAPGDTVRSLGHPLFGQDSECS